MLEVLSPPSSRSFTGRRTPRRWMGLENAHDPLADQLLGLPEPGGYHLGKARLESHAYSHDIPVVAAVRGLLSKAV